MSSAIQKSRTARAIAIFGATLLIISQVVGVAHFHDGAASRAGVASTALSSDPGFCPVCQLALHSPGSVSAPVIVANDLAAAEAVLAAPTSRFESLVFSTARVRAPPVAL